jgi:phage-related protein
MPSAKMAFLNEAVLYLSHLPAETRKFIALSLDRHQRRDETLVAYYVRTYRHLLDGLTIYEIDPASNTVEEHTFRF